MKLVKSLSVAALVLVAMGAGMLTQRYLDGARQASGRPGDKRIDFAMTDVDGKTRRLSEWDGKVILVNFWATWCPPCLREIPGFVQLQAEYGSRGLEIVGVAVDDHDTVRQFVREHGINYPVLVGDEDGSVSRQYGNDMGALPYSILIDRHGRIVETRRGVFPFPEAEKAIKALL